MDPFVFLMATLVVFPFHASAAQGVTRPVANPLTSTITLGKTAFHHVIQQKGGSTLVSPSISNLAGPSIIVRHMQPKADILNIIPNSFVSLISGAVFLLLWRLWRNFRADASESNALLQPLRNLHCNGLATPTPAEHSMAMAAYAADQPSSSVPPLQSGLSPAYGLFLDDNEYDVIVVGAGHAGCEAALASARLGARTLLLTMTLDKIAWQPCNPAVGGSAKSHLVHEVDALGGEMGKAADACYLHKRLLNASKGPAVHALRAQTDKVEYSQYMRGVLETTDNLCVREGTVSELLLDYQNDEVLGVQTMYGMDFRAPCVVLTAGTFMNGTIWVGRTTRSAGRAGEQASTGISEQLAHLGFVTDRLKTGTPPRVDGRTVNFSAMDPMPGDDRVRWFTYDTTRHLERPQMHCYGTRTTAATHQLIRDNLHETPIYGGWVDSKGPRNCPSIEDKIVKFAEKQSHPVFLEPEGRRTPEMYVQGCSTGLPEKLQLGLLRSLPGLEQVKMIRPGYAIEYDYIPATQCTRTLQSKKVKGLYLAGQVCGTTGYEEAAAQGIVAGANAALAALGRPPLEFPRESSYIGTMIDDLITKQQAEPYRVFTSRSEHRLLLRSDNADQRLTPIGYACGLVPEEQWAQFQAKCARMETERKRLATHRVDPTSPLAMAVAAKSGQAMKGPMTLEGILRRPHVQYSLLEEYGLGAPPEEDLHISETDSLEVEIKYDGFIRRAQQQSERVAASLGMQLPPDLDYSVIHTISLISREKLQTVRPETLAHASRIPGVTSADISALRLHMDLMKRRLKAAVATA